MKNFKRLDTTFGWVAFLIAAVTYCLTVEPTASFWDCPEFILSGNKLEVGHPPGAPFFMLTANFFSLFAEPHTVAYMVNIMSALLSAAGILFLFWTITHLTRRLIVGKRDVISKSQTVTILASGMVGALAYTWSDTYWFSAVEGEVYAYSSLFTSVVFWLILKWEESEDSPKSDRWLILIAYLTGLSIGVHLLNLLCLPAIVLVAYYKKYPYASWKGSLLALVISAVLVAVVLYGIVPGVVKVGGWFELLFVNGFGMPFNSGVIAYLLLLFGTLVTGIIFTVKEKKQSAIAALFTLAVALLGIPFYGHSLTISIIIGIIVLFAIYKIGTYYSGKAKKFLVSLRTFNTAFLCMLMIMVGYASYALIVIRSSANTPMDQNSPEDIFTLGTYLNREQYGTRPLFYGQHFASEIEWNKDGTPAKSDGSPTYIRNSEGEYERLRDINGEIEYNGEYKYKENMLFPRMHSSSHTGEYLKWIDRKPNNRKAPTQGENLKFFMRYQVNHMYWRYFMWNFVGRQNDIQNSYGEREHGNWITGIPFLDNARLGDQDKLPSDLKENKGRNVFFALPLLLGICGIIWQLTRGKAGKQQGLIVFMLFFMTGLAIVLYLNQTPMQPRERDYAYAGSFYAFAIWIGMGVAALASWYKEFHAKNFGEPNENTKLIASGVVAVLCLLVPIQMVSQTWDDHDRSGRYACRDFGQNYLNTLPDEGCPIIFTCGDNDTFPLWYNQEVEGVRTDARVCNLSYLSADWYIDQMRRPAYDSPSLPITLEREDYAGNTNIIIYVMPQIGTEIIQQYLDEHPEEAALIGDIRDIRNIVKYWVCEANDAEKSKERIAVEKILEYTKPRLENIAQMIAEQSYGQDDIDNRRYAEHLKTVADRINSNSALIPSSTITIPIDYEAVKRSGMKIPAVVEAGFYHPENMEIDLMYSAIQRHELLMFDMLANANWERPMYMATTVGSSNYPEVLENFFVLEGLAYRITPFNWTQLKEQGIDTEKFYNNVMNRFNWGGLKEGMEEYYADETIRRMVTTHRSFITHLAANMLVEIDYMEDDKAIAEQTKKIIALLDKLETELPEEASPYNPLSDTHNAIKVASIYRHLYDIHADKKESEHYIGDEVVNKLKEKSLEVSAGAIRTSMEYLNWFKHKSEKKDFVSLLYNAVEIFISDLDDKEIETKLNEYSVGFSLSEIFKQLELVN